MLSYLESICIITGINLIAVLGLAFFTGFTGNFSFGHAGFVALGAYASAISSVRLSLPFPVSLALGALVAGLVAFGIGIPTLRIKGTYFAIVALGFGETVRISTIMLKDLTGGASGYSAIPLQTTLPWVLALSILSFILVWNLAYSPVGRACVCVKNDEIAASASGIPVHRTRLTAFVVSGVLCGLSGGLLAHYLTYLQPNMFDIAMSSQLSITVLLGGLNSVTGPTIATFILVTLPEVFRLLAKWRLTIYGLAIILTVIVRPEGLLGGRELTLWRREDSSLGAR
ncbi:MAG TPA: branched-chain amino acid ABC transporter permease [Firmicutes bacterium]|nr:branched-chain amino acid ABC transporter permease [Bacillota bacterium]